MKRITAVLVTAVFALGFGGLTATAAVADDAPPEEVTAVVETVEAPAPEVVVEETPPVVEAPAPAEVAAPAKKLATRSVAAVPAAVVTVGVFGTIEPWSEDTNHEDYWEDREAPHDAVCYKHEAEDGNNAHGSITDGGKTVTLNPYGDDWPGDHYEWLIIKGGNVSNNVIWHPVAGVAYASPLNSAGNQSDVSHWIVCKGTTPDDEPTVVVPNDPKVKDLCGTEDDHYGLPEATEGVTYSRDGKDIIAVLETGYAWGEYGEGWAAEEGQLRFAFEPDSFTDEPCIVECPTETVQPTSTNVNPQGWTLVNGEWIDGGVEFTASNWSDAYAAKDVSFPLSAASNLGLNTTGGTVWAIILETSAGNVHYEPEPYTDDLWTNAPGILPANGGGQGGPYSGDLEDIISDPTVTKVYLYFTSGSSEPESGVLHSGSYNCLEQPFDYENIETPLPAQFNADPTPPDCGVPGTFDFAGLEGQFPHVTITVTNNGDGSYFLEAETDPGYEFPDGTTYKSRTIEVLGALLYQADNNEADCFVEPKADDESTTSGEPECEDTSVVTTTTTVHYTLNVATGEWIAGEPVVTHDLLDIEPTTCPGGLAFTGANPLPNLALAGGLLLLGLLVTGGIAWRRAHN